jgi:hypothetical protein
VSIIIQGPILLKDNFTYTTALLYKKYFTNAVIIISTWEGVPMSCIKKIENSGIILLLNKMPSYNGFGNINFQIITTLAGVNYAKKNNLKYILKTRTDQRFYNKESIQYFRNLYNQEEFNNRIIVSSLNTFYTRLFSISDMFQFGKIETIYKFWNINLIERINEKELKINNDLLLIPEIFLIYTYLKNNKFDLKWSQISYESALVKYFYVLDKESIDLFWNKYNALENNRNIYIENNDLNEAGNLYWHNIKKR